MDLTIHLPCINLYSSATWLYIYIIICYLVTAIFIRIDLYYDKRDNKAKQEDVKAAFWLFIYSPVIIPGMLLAFLLSGTIFLVANFVIVFLNILTYLAIGEIAFGWFKFGD